MNNLQVEQLDKKLKKFNKLNTSQPSSGWIYVTRKALGMSLKQLGDRMGITAQSVKEMEQREKDGVIGLNALNEAAKALGLRLTYGFSAPVKNLEQMINERSKIKAEQIVLRTHKTMSLEKQANSKARIKRATNEQATEIANKKPKYLWD